jgi:DNA invertase Pin-like site-specific DNA recombinase
MNKIIGYARASATDPDIAAQEKALWDAGCDKVYVEKTNRVSLARDGAIEAVPPLGQLVVTRIDRLALHVGDFHRIVKQLHSVLASVRVLYSGLNIVPVKIPQRDTFLHALNVFAELEATHLREGRLIGIAKAKAKGIYKGRRKTIRPSKVFRLKAEGLGPTAICDALAISRTSYYRVLRDNPEPAVKDKT